MGAAIGEDPDLRVVVCSWVMGAAKNPVWAKMTTNVTHFEDPSRAAFRAGCQGVSAINTIRSVMGVDLDTLLLHYFGTDDPDAISPETLVLGKEKLAVDFGVERESGRRFALWTLMEALGFAPLPADAFAKEPALKRAAEEYLSAGWRVDRV